MCLEWCQVFARSKWRCACEGHDIQGAFRASKFSHSGKSCRSWAEGHFSVSSWSRSFLPACKDSNRSRSWLLRASNSKANSWASCTVSVSTRSLTDHLFNGMKALGNLAWAQWILAILNGLLDRLYFDTVKVRFGHGT